MPNEWAQVETLIGELGSVRTAAYACRVSAAGYATVEQAIAEATDALVDTLNAPSDPKLMARAHESIEVAAEVLVTLDGELVKTRHLRARSAELRVRARELVEQARKQWAG